MKAPVLLKKTGIDKDSKRISDGLRQGAVNVLLDPEGQRMDFPTIGEELRNWRDGGTKEVTFIVGGPNGVSEELEPQLTKDGVFHV